MAKTSDQVREEFHHRGESFAEWARANGFPLSLVYAVMSGRRRALRGKTHAVSVALGLKDAYRGTKRRRTRAPR